MAVRESPFRQQPRDAACPTCGAPAERGQLVCLECGSRVALAYRRPPSWKLPVAIVVIIGALALAGAVVAYNAIDDDARDEVSETPPKPKQNRPASGGATDGKAAPAAGASGGLVKQGKLYSWPRGLEGFTVVLLSGEDRESATAFANEVADRNDAKAGVITSEDFGSLPQGFFLVFGGIYETRERAEQALARLSGRYPGSFAQLVKR